MKNSLIFDLDGTLWEVIESTFNSANIITKKYNLKEISKDTICKVFGLNRQQAAKIYFPNIEQTKAVKLLDEISSINIENIDKNGGNIYPNLKDTLNLLAKNYDLYIVSNTSKLEYIKAFLKSSDTEDLFKDYIAASKLKISKAEAINKLISEKEIKKAVYIGDTAGDLEAAEINNIPFIQAKYGFGEDLKTKYFINEIKQLPKVLEEIF